MRVSKEAAQKIVDAIGAGFWPEAVARVEKALAALPDPESELDRLLRELRKVSRKEWLAAVWSDESWCVNLFSEHITSGDSGGMTAAVAALKHELAKWQLAGPYPHWWKGEDDAVDDASYIKYESESRGTRFTRFGEELPDKPVAESILSTLLRWHRLPGEPEVVRKAREAEAAKRRVGIDPASPGTDKTVYTVVEDSQSAAGGDAGVPPPPTPAESHDTPPAAADPRDAEITHLRKELAACDLEYFPIYEWVRALGIIQRLQPPGSPPPGGPIAMAEWIVESVAADNARLRAELAAAQSGTGNRCVEIRHER